MRPNKKQEKINAFEYKAIPRPRDYFAQHGATGVDPSTFGMNPSDEPVAMPKGNSTLDYLEFARQEAERASKESK